MKNVLPKGFSYSEAKNEDTSLAQGLIYQVLQEYGLHTNDASLDSDMLDIEANFQNGFFGLVKNEDSEVVGTFALYPEGVDSFEIRKMYLLPAYRGLGIGRWMLEFLILKANKKQAQQVTLKTASVLEAAIALYRKTGFDEVTCSTGNPRCDRAFKMDLNHFYQNSNT